MVTSDVAQSAAGIHPGVRGPQAGGAEPALYFLRILHLCNRRECRAEDLRLDVLKFF